MRRSRFKPKYRRKASLWKGAVAGLVGGLAASWVMGQYQQMWMKIGEQIQQNQTGDEPRTQPTENEDVTIETASIISEHVFDHELSDEGEKDWGSGCTLRCWCGNGWPIWRHL